MTAKEYMKQVQRLLRRIDRKQKEADALRQKLSFPKSPAIKEGETIAPTKNPNPESKATKTPNNPIFANLPYHLLHHLCFHNHF